MILGFCTVFFSLVNSVPHGQALEQWSLWLLASSSEPLRGFAARQLAGRAARFDRGSATLSCGTAVQLKTAAKGTFRSTSWPATSSFPETSQTDFVAARPEALYLHCIGRVRTAQALLS